MEVKTYSDTGSINSSNLVSNNSEVLIIWHLRVVPKTKSFASYQKKALRVVPKTKGLLLTGKKASSVKQQVWGTCSKRPSRMCQLLYVLTPWLPLDQLLQLWTLRKHKRQPWWHWSSRLMQYLDDLVVQPKYRSSIKQLPIRTWLSIGTIW